MQFRIKNSTLFHMTDIREILNHKFRMNGLVCGAIINENPVNSVPVDTYKTF